MTTASTPKKRIRRTARSSGVEPARPRCNIHSELMVFNPVEQRWGCPHKDCTRIAYPKHDDSEDRNAIIKGDTELVILRQSDDVRFFLKKSNVLVEVTEWCDEESFQAQDGYTYSYFTMRVPNKRVIDHTMGGT